MDNVSTWVSLAALMVSVGTLLYTILRNTSQIRLDAVQKRSDLLTKIVVLKLEYEQEVKYLSWLANVAHNYSAPGSADLLKQALAYKTFVLQTQEHYDRLIDATSASKIALVEIEHHIDSLKIRVEKESETLQKKKEIIESLLALDNEIT